MPHAHVHAHNQPDTNAAASAEPSTGANILWLGTPAGQRRTPRRRTPGRSPVYRPEQKGRGSPPPCALGLYGPPRPWFRWAVDAATPGAASTALTITHGGRRPSLGSPPLADTFTATSGVLRFPLGQPPAYRPGKTHLYAGSSSTARMTNEKQRPEDTDNQDDHRPEHGNQHVLDGNHYFNFFGGFELCSTPCNHGHLSSRLSARSWPYPLNGPGIWLSGKSSAVASASRYLGVRPAFPCSTLLSEVLGTPHSSLSARMLRPLARRASLMPPGIGL